MSNFNYPVIWALKIESRQERWMYSFVFMLHIQIMTAVFFTLKWIMWTVYLPPVCKIWIWTAVDRQQTKTFLMQIAVLNWLCRSIWFHPPLSVLYFNQHTLQSFTKEKKIVAMTSICLLASNRWSMKRWKIVLVTSCVVAALLKWQ